MNSLTFLMQYFQFLAFSECPVQIGSISGIAGARSYRPPSPVNKICAPRGSCMASAITWPLHFVMFALSGFFGPGS